MKKICILLSTYNGEKYIVEQLESLRTQTRKIDEILIIDDCSTDNTFQLCLDYIKNNNLSTSWRIEKNEKNKGWITNFHEGQKRIRGDILMFCDQDDIWLPEKVQQAENILNRFPYIEAIATYEYLLYSEGSIVKPDKMNDELEVIDISKNPKAFYIQCSGCTMAIRKEFIDKIYNEFTSTWAHDDMIWKLAGANGKLMVCHNPLIFHRIHENNASRQKQRVLQERINDIKDNLKNLYAFKNYLKNNITVAGYSNTIKVVDKHIRGNEQRVKFMQTRNVFYYIKLVLFYRDTYRTMHQMLGDFAVVLKGH